MILEYIRTHLENLEEKVGVCRDVVAWTGGIFIEVRVTIFVKLNIEGEHILGIQPVKKNLTRGNEHLVSANKNKHNNNININIPMPSIL